MPPAMVDNRCGTHPAEGDPKVSSRSVTRVAVVAAASLFAVLVTGAPALAHTKVTIDNPQAGAVNVKVSLVAEAENPAAGIALVRVVMPDGVDPATVRLVTGPPTWRLVPDGTAVSTAGQPLPKRTDAKIVFELPEIPRAAKSLAFKTVVTYTDGKSDRWIELPTSDNPNPDHPAPVVNLKAAAPLPSPTLQPSVPSEEPAPPTSEAPTTAAATSPGGGGGTPLGLIVTVVSLLVSVILAVIIAVAVLVRRRRRPPTTDAH
jgi:hypothetical protein